MLGWPRVRFSSRRDSIGHDKTGLLVAARIVQRAVVGSVMTCFGCWLCTDSVTFREHSNKNMRIAFSDFKKTGYKEPVLG